MKRYRRKQWKNGKVLFWLIVFVIVFIVLYTIFSVRMMPIVKVKAVNNTKSMATQTINNAIAKVVKEKGIDYDKMMILEKDSDGKITAIKADTLQIDTLKYEITNEAVEELNHLRDKNLSIPLGNVIGGQIFSGTGPRISVCMEPVGNVQTKVVNEFSSAGINQTRQQITLIVKAEITVMVSTDSVTASIESNFPLADTVIVGNVPNSYTVVDDSAANNQSNSQKIFTYGKNNNTSSK